MEGMSMTSYIKEYRVDDIPDYPFLFIRDGAFVYMTNKHTGEISEALSVSEYCQLWNRERQTNPLFISYYEKGYSYPKPSPDTAKNISELVKLCSDKTRHRKGDDGFLLDFMWQEGSTLTITETKLFRYICTNVEVWNYSVVTEDSMIVTLGKGLRHTRDTFKSLESKGLIRVLNTKFDCHGEWKTLVKVHPKLYWKGRYSAWLAAIGESYEYEDSPEID
jgi:hypothetical protein